MLINKMTDSQKVTKVKEAEYDIQNFWFQRFRILIKKLLTKQRVGE